MLHTATTYVTSQTKKLKGKHLSLDDKLFILHEVIEKGKFQYQVAKELKRTQGAVSRVLKEYKTNPYLMYNL